MKKCHWVGMLPFYLLALIICVGAASIASESVSTAVQNSPVALQHRIMIDAGHGGIDGGATSCTGKLESAFNLEIALRLNDLLHLLGFETVMVRTTDTSIHTEGKTIAAQKVSDLRERVRIANETEGAILISIHQNTFPDSRYDGAQVFYGENTESVKLAEVLQNNFNQCFHPESKRVCKKAQKIYLLQNIRCTGVLIECGFISNPIEEAKLRDGSYQQQMCCVIASSLMNFLYSRG